MADVATTLRQFFADHREDLPLNEQAIVAAAVVGELESPEGLRQNAPVIATDRAVYAQALRDALRPFGRSLGTTIPARAVVAELSQPESPVQSVAPTPPEPGEPTAPTLTAVTPASLETGQGDVGITVDGSGFSDTDTVNLDGLPLTTAFVSDTQLTAGVPTDGETARTAQVTVWHGDGMTNAVSLTFTVPEAV